MAGNQLPRRAPRAQYHWDGWKWREAPGSVLPHGEKGWGNHPPTPRPLFGGGVYSLGDGNSLALLAGSLVAQGLEVASWAAADVEMVRSAMGATGELRAKNAASCFS